ncbi:uncharacterized protein SPSK_08073 [Sporothrix schenckii 1099-18]|uniref:Uncharacterized protein n=1 Tax=Sporothrix schenckii 1099-18 TaxID=1397361 RepID=A0A0F2MDJ5_SPOSC|nr:uncharacterized protein SPSK_08073 [Sporothrix schenckii 1099-18]KJR87707.1 hypothetical protein SPSK_08073 [Sporothrix schenckii 1099-18]
MSQLANATNVVHENAQWNAQLKQFAFSPPLSHEAQRHDTSKSHNKHHNKSKATPRQTNHSQPANMGHDDVKKDKGTTLPAPNSAVTQPVVKTEDKGEKDKKGK